MRGVCVLGHAETNPLDLRVVQVLRNGQVIRVGESLTVRQCCQVHSGLTEQYAVRAQRSSKKRQTKPIEISHKSLALKELTSDGFGLLYAKGTQFRVVEAATLAGQAMPEAGTQSRSLAAGSSGPDWRRNGTGRPGKLNNGRPAGAAGKSGGCRWRRPGG